MSSTSRRTALGLPLALAVLLLSQLVAVAALTPPAVPREPGPVMAIGHAEIGEAPAPWSPKDYDGVQLTVDAPDLTELPTVHGVYVLPSDAPNRFGQFAAHFQAEHRRASRFLTNATGMAFRWDERKSRDGRRLHDITVVRSAFPSSLMSLADVQFELVGRALADAGLTDPDKKYYVWLDGPSSSTCGQGQQPLERRRHPDNLANTSTYAVSYRVDLERYESAGGFCNPVLHELMHGLGAVAPFAPHSYSGGHCNDDPNDVMCLIDASPGGVIDRDRPRTLDSGNDDYLDPAADLQVRGGDKLGFWTANLSRFLCPRSKAKPTRPDCAKANDPDY